MTLREKCELYGFGYEEYKTTTQDGYILTLMRVPYAPNNRDEQDKPPVYMIHPINGHGNLLFYDGPDHSPGFELATKGFDVWVLNFRFTQVSRAHVSLDPDTDPEFYDYDMVTLRYDLMADIQFIIDNTNFDSIAVYGYGFGGTTLSYAMAIEPEFFSTHVNIASLIASGPSYAHTQSLFYLGLAEADGLLNVLRSMGINYVNPTDFPTSIINQMLCVPYPPLCNVFVRIFSAESDPYNDEDGSIRSQLFQDNSLTLQLSQHLAQSVRTGRVSYFDYGPVGNLEAYGTEEAPLIPIENTINDVALLGSEIDHGTDPQDIIDY